MKFIKAILIVTIMYITNFSWVCASELKFLDLEKHWAQNAIETFVTNGIMNGYPDNTIKPDENVTMVEFLKMIIVAGKYDLIRVGDVIWPDFYLNTAIKNDLIKQEEVEKYNEPISRYQACEIIGNYLDITDIKNASNRFKDLSGENTTIVLKLVKLEIIDGYKDKTFRGDNPLTRAEAVTLISRALDKKTELVKIRNYEISDEKYSNYGVNDSDKKCVFANTSYEIVDGKILIFDTGRYAKLDGYIISGDVINTKNVIKTIQELINEKAYVAVLYQPSEYTINQLQIIYGDSKEKVFCGENDFSFTFYENKFYELARVSMEEKFSDKVFVKIEVAKLWGEYAEFKNGKLVDSLKKSKLQLALKAICKSDADRICNYIAQKNKEFVKGKMQGKELKEHECFNNYVVDFYKKENGVPTFYLSER